MNISQNKLHAYLLILLAITFGSLPCSLASEPTIQKIKVVMDDNYPPFVFKDKSGNLSGILIDQWNLWEKKTGIKVEIHAMDWGKALNLMEKGQFQVIDTIFYNEKRAKIFDFSKPYTKIEVPIFFNKNISGINKIESLQGFTVAVKKADACIDYLQRNGITNLVEYDSYEAIIQEAKQQKIVVFVIDKPPALYYLYKYEIQDKFNYTDSLYTGEFHRAVQKGNTQLLKVVEDGFAKIAVSEYKAIDRKWYGTPYISPQYYKYFAGLIITTLLILLILVFWNHLLQKKVKEKTFELVNLLEKYRVSEERYRLLAENSSDIIAIHDLETRYTYISPAIEIILGYKTEELIGKKPTDIMFPQDKVLLFHSSQEVVIDQKKTELIDLRFLDVKGNCHWLQCVVKPICDPDGQILYLQSISRDITERKKAEEEKRKLEGQIIHAQKLESLGVLAGGIAHDFNNLLVAILGNIDLVLAGLPKDSGIRENLEDAEKASLRAAELAKQMLAYSGKGKFEIQAVDINEIIKEMSSIFEVSISKKANLLYEYGNNLPRIKADINQIRQVAMNLILNSSESLGDKNGQIMITTGVKKCDYQFLADNIYHDKLPAGNYVFCEVKDNGYGMDEETQKRIFEPFFTTKFTGRGLGLAVVLGIVRGHKGIIKLTSKLNEGTSFVVLFPVMNEDEKLSLASPEITPVIKDKEFQGNNRLIFIVDDDESVRKLAKRMLEQIGFRVITAVNGREAVELYKNYHRDKSKDEIYLVILDLTMPEMDGEETFRELHKINSNLKIILSSGYNELEITPRFAGIGLNGFIQKPYQIKTLKEILFKVLDEK